MLDKTEVREWLIFENQGQRIFSVLHRPVDKEHAPLVVFFHGFASNKCGSNRSYVSFAQQLTKAGMACLRFDFRGSGDSEGTLETVSFEDLVSDAVTVLNNVVKIESIDSRRVAIFGSSLGGSIALVAAERFETKPKAMALWSPVASGELWYHDFLRRHPEHIQSDPAKILASYRGNKLHPQFQQQFAKLFACKNMQHLMPLPILHMHGENDEMVSIRHQEAFRAACSPSCLKYVKFAEAQHALGYSQFLPDIIDETTNWFKLYL